MKIPVAQPVLEGPLVLSKMEHPPLEGPFVLRLSKYERGEVGDLNGTTDVLYRYAKVP